MRDVIEVSFPFGSQTLAGSLHCPPAAPPWPAIIMLQGSGPADRDSGGFFVPIRDHLVEAGVAVLSWDKQGIGGSTGDWRRQTLFDRADEARAALAWLRRRASIDARRIGVWGHSQGGWVGPLVAAQEPDVAALVIHSGTGVTIEEQDFYGLEHTMRRDGASDAEVAQGSAFLTALHAAANAAKPFTEVQDRLLAPAAGTPWLAYFDPLGSDEWEFFVRNFNRPYDPLWALHRVRCPALAVFGERDVLIPVDRSIRILQETLAPVNPALSIHVFPEADHRLKVGDPPGFAFGYFETTIAWIGRQLGTHGTKP